MRRSPSVGSRRLASGTPRLMIAAGAALWILLISGWMGLLVAHQYRSGEASNLSGRWPQASRLDPGSGTHTVVLFAHPQCPCLSATLTEMERLRTLVGVPFRLLVVFADEPVFDLPHSRHFRRVSAWNHVTVISDPGSREATLFGARTSGQVLIFDNDRRLVFRGGITESRAHEGDSDNLARAIAAFGVRDAQVKAAPVYGCSLR